MKKFLKLSLIFSVLMLTFVACSRNEESAELTINDQLTGTWLRTALYIDGTAVNDPCYMKGTMVFTKTHLTFNLFQKNNSGSCVPYLNETGSYIIDEKEKKITYEKPNGEYDLYFYELQGDILAISWVSKVNGKLYVNTLKRN